MSSGMSNVGASGTYEAGDQRNEKNSVLNAQAEANRFHEGKENSHKANDSKDERSIANQLEREEKRQKEPSPEAPEVTESKKDSTLPAKNHGNEPSKGAKVDQELKEEEEQIMKKKGNFGPN
ncbi:hypothetical protein WHR41_03180 [Cladosporium halotolerans]|uniref:Uncharacterized protein n=1 Tax=Cladosporium halotolerans TaxID=1052096 RepID=A0AB34KXV7_9PEZI